MTGFEPGSSSIGSELCHNAVIYLYFIETYLNRIITLYALGRFVYNRISTFLMFTRSKKIYHDRHSKLQDLKMTFFSVSKKPKGQFFIVLSCFMFCGRYSFKQQSQSTRESCSKHFYFAIWDFCNLTKNVFCILPILLCIPDFNGTNLTNFYTKRSPNFCNFSG